MNIDKPLNIGFVSRSTLYSSPGGDTVQIEMTAKYLNRLGQNVKVFRSDEIIDYKEFDVFHFFNITRPADMLNHVLKSQKPFFISPIYLDLDEFETRNRKGVQGLIARILNSSRLEYLKCIARYMRNGEKVNSWQYFLLGHFNSMQKLLKKCNAILPNSFSEYQRIQNHFEYKGDYEVIPCGVDTEIFEVAVPQKDENLILCIGRIEGRKNQLSLIRALYNTNYQLVIIGNPSPNHKAYYEACKKAANERVTFIENIEQKELIKYYQKAKVHVLASWFETVGLSSLEAAFCNCNIVVCNKGDVSDYFKENVWYCSPDNEEDILRAVNEAMNAPLSDMMKNEIQEKYTWEIAAKKTLEAYQSYL
ncbi:MAG: glycosyltransferase family 4 protein [Bacteroidota bacterium]